MKNVTPGAWLTASVFIERTMQIPGRPAMGAWLSYGLGTMNEDLPSYVVMTSSDAAKT